MPSHSNLSLYHDFPPTDISNNIPELRQTYDIAPQLCRHDHLDQIQLDDLTCLRCGRRLKQRSNTTPSRIPTPPWTGDSQHTNGTFGTAFATLARRPSSSIYTESIAVADPSRSEFDNQRSYSPVSPLLPPLPLFSDNGSPTFNNPILTSSHTNISTTTTAEDTASKRINLTSKSPLSALCLCPPLPQHIRFKALRRFKGKLNKMLQYRSIAQLDARKLPISRPALVASDSYGLCNGVYDVHGGFYDGQSVPGRPEHRPAPLYHIPYASQLSHFHQSHPNGNFIPPSTVGTATSYALLYPQSPPEDKIAVHTDHPTSPSYPSTSLSIYQQPTLSLLFTLFLNLSSLPLATPQGRATYLSHLQLFSQQSYFGKPGYKIDIGYFINGQKVEILVGGLMSRVFFANPTDPAIDGEGGVFRTVTVTECLRDFTLESCNVEGFSSSSSGRGKSRKNSSTTPTKKHRFLSFSSDSSDPSSSHSHKNTSSVPPATKQKHTHPHPLTLPLATLGPVLNSPYEAFLHHPTGAVYFITDLPRGFRSPNDHVGRVERKCWRSSRCVGVVRMLQSTAELVEEVDREEERMGGRERRSSGGTVRLREMMLGLREDKKKDAGCGVLGRAMEGRKAKVRWGGERIDRVGWEACL